MKEDSHMYIYIYIYIYEYCHQSNRIESKRNRTNQNNVWYLKCLVIECFKWQSNVSLRECINLPVTEV